MLTVVILTKNEENNIAGAILSLKPLKIPYKVLVFDSFSTDRTVEESLKYGAKVFVGKWRGYSEQRLRALKLIDTPWTLFLDADERLTPELCEEISYEIEAETADGYFIKRKNYYMGKLQRMLPTKILRLARTDKIDIPYVSVHEKLKIKGRVKTLKNPMIHFPYENLEHQWKKNTNYAKLFAMSSSKDGIIHIISRMPLIFLRYYFLNLAILDGVEGLIFSLSQAWYHTQKYMLTYENNKKG